MPIGYFLSVMSLVCAGGMVSIVMASATYVLSKRLRVVKAVLAATTAFFLVVIGLPTLFGFVDEVKRGALTPFKADDLVGTWSVNYEDVGFHRASGAEIITLRHDGTYQQVFKDGEGYVYTSPWYKWWLEGGRVVHLEQGRFYLNGIVRAEMLARGDAEIAYPEITLDGTEIILYALHDSSALGGVILEHLPVGDGDSPDIVQFHRVSTSVPMSTDVP